MQRFFILSIFLSTFSFAQHTIEWSSGNLGSYGISYANIDVDNDGLNELAIITSNGITFYNGNYTVCWTIPIIPGFTYPGYAIPRDINGDGLIVPINTDNDPSGELVTYSYRYTTQYESKFRVYDATTHNLEWESPLLQGSYGWIQVEDLDGDNKAEIIINRSVDNNYYVDVYAHSGSGVEDNTYTEKFSSQTLQSPMPRTSLPKGSFELYDLLGRIHNSQNINKGIYFFDYNEKRVKVIIE